MKSIGTKDKRTGIAKHKDKPLKVSQPNQWTGNPQQLLMMEHYLDVTKPNTFANVYRSALAAGYEDSYAKKLSAPTNAAKWLSEYVLHSNLTVDHLKAQLNEMIIDRSKVDSRSVDDTRIKAIELTAKLEGFIDNKGGNTTNILVQPILGGKSVRADVVSEQ